MIKLSLLAALCAVLCAHSCLGAPPALHVVGTRLVDNQGRVVRLQGVNVPSLEWTSGGDHVVQSVGAALDTWNANVIRLPLCQDRWFGKAVDNQFARTNAPVSDGGLAYRLLVDRIVNRIASRDKYVVLDLHWSDGGQWGQHIGQHVMPDDNSTLFWRSLAARYANNSAVLFDLYNEPHDTTWDFWQNGGEITEHNSDPNRGSSLQYHSPGMQGLLDTVRATGARNVVVAGGLDWAYDLTGIVNGHALVDPDGRGVMYATHIYPQKKDWDLHVTPAAAKYAVFVGEVGCEPWEPGRPVWEKVDPPVWAPQVLAYINQHQFSWTAWSFHPGAQPCLITGWDYQPTPYWGVYVKAALAARAAQTPQRLPSPRRSGPPTPARDAASLTR